MTNYCVGYTTVPDLVTAKNLARSLLEKKLAACVNILPNMTSIYSWQNQIEESQELVLIIKTQTQHQAKLEETLLEIHPYKCPCLIFLPISGGHFSFLEWIGKETSPS